MFNPVIISFVSFLLMITSVGILSSIYTKKSTEDYYLGSRNIGPWAVALSAIATNNSGFMFIGMIGATYTMGISSIWMLVGWILGDYIAWFFVHQRLRQISGDRNTLTIPSFIGTGAQSSSRILICCTALLSTAFLGCYAAAQLNAGSKALHVLFGWDYSTGAILGSLLIVIYCFSGGIRATIWTDVFQSFIMIFVMWGLFYISVNEIGGLRNLWQSLASIDPQLLSWIPFNLKFGFTLYLVGWIAAGIGVVGQPHIMVRTMVLKDSLLIRRVRKIYMSWYILFAFATIGIGLCCRVLLPQIALFDAELALPKLAQRFLPQVLVGLALAGLFSATMSTADSQILVCSSSLSHDLFPRFQNSYNANKIFTILVTASALAISIFGSQSVFHLVVFSWSGLAATLGPLVILRAFNISIPGHLGVCMLIVGLVTAMYWNLVLGLSGSLYEVLPGMAASFLSFALLRPFFRNGRTALQNT